MLAAGGLYIVGTERHESRRIDNQLRGRSGRQGDPGESRFFLSAEDDLVRLFAGDRIYRILDRLGTVDEEGREEPIEAWMLSKQIEKAQKKVEEQNFLQRKRVLEYDDVMNEQRRIVYRYRNEILEGKDMGATAREEIGNVITRTVAEFTPVGLHRGLGPRGHAHRARGHVPGRAHRRRSSPTEHTDREELVHKLHADAITLYNAREEELGEELMRAVERFVLLQFIDQRWREHLYDMDYLREGIHLRGFAQIEPIVAYKNEAFTLFEDLMASIWADFTRMIFNLEVEALEEEEAAGAALRAERHVDAARPRLLLRRRPDRAERARARGGRRRARSTPRRSSRRRRRSSSAS